MSTISCPWNREYQQVRVLLSNNDGSIQDFVMPISVYSILDGISLPVTKPCICSKICTPMNLDLREVWVVYIKVEKNGSSIVTLSIITTWTNLSCNRWENKLSVWWGIPLVVNHTLTIELIPAIYNFLYLIIRISCFTWSYFKILNLNGPISKVNEAELSFAIRVFLHADC